MSNNTMTIDELCNDVLFDVDIDISKAVTLMGTITGNYFEASADALEKDSQKMFIYKKSYGEIQSLLSILFDYIWDIKKKMDHVMEAEIVRLGEGIEHN